MGTLIGPAGTRQCTAEGRAGGKDEPEVLEEREQERGPVSRATLGTRAEHRRGLQAQIQELPETPEGCGGAF